MYENEKYTGDIATPRAESLTSIEEVHGLVKQLENRLRPILKPEMPQKAPTSENSKSELMQELEFVKNHLNEILSRLHI